MFQKNAFKFQKEAPNFQKRASMFQSFLPDDTTETLRTYCRQRSNWIQQSSEATHKMQKYLRLLNFRLDVVVKDVCGLTGLAIIEDICKGNLNPLNLQNTDTSTAAKAKKKLQKL